MADDNVVFKIEADNSSLQRDMRETQRIITSAVNSISGSSDRLGGSLSNAGNSSDRLSGSLDNAAGYTDELGRNMRNSAGGADDLSDSARRASDNIDDLGNNSENSAERTDKLKNSIDKVKSSLDDAKDTVGKYAAAVSTAFVAVGTAAVKSAADAESAFAKVKTLLSEGTDLDGYYKDIMAASMDTGVDFGSFAESVYGAISASIAQNKAVGFTQNAVKLAKGGFTETATAVDVLTTAINAYGLAADDAEHISDVLIMTQNLGKTTVDELAHSMGQTIPIANSAHVAVEELSAQYAVMTKNGVATAEAGTQIKAMLNELNASGTTVDKTLKEISGRSFSQLKDEGSSTADILGMLSEYAQSSGQKLSDLFGSVEAGAAALTLVKDGGKDLTDILAQMYDSAGATESAFETMSDTIEAKTQKLVNKIKLIFTDAGKELLPVVDELIAYVDENSDEIEIIIKDITELVKDLTIELAEIMKVLWEHKEAVAAVVAGYIAFKTAVSFGNVISATVSAIKTLKAAADSAAASQAALNAVLNMNPYVLAASAIAAVTTGIIAFSAASKAAAEDISHISGEVSTLAVNAKNAVNEQKNLSDIISEYKEISENVDAAADKKERLASLQEKLNDLYGDEKSGIDLLNGSYEDQIELLDRLSDVEKARRLNQIDQDLTNAYDARDSVAGYQNFELYVNKNAVGGVNEFYKKYSEIIRDNGQAAVTAWEEGDDFILSLSGSIDETIDMLTELENSLLATGEASGKYADQFNDVHDRKAQLEEIRDGISALEQQRDILTNGIENNTESLYENTQAADDNSRALFDAVNAANNELAANASQKNSADELTESMKKVISEYEGMSEAINKVTNNEALTYDQINELIRLYPEIADKISATADGYIVEAEAAEMLNQMLYDGANAQIEAENEKTRAAIEGARARIIMYEREAATLAQAGESEKVKALSRSISEERAYMEEMQAKLKTNSLIVPQLTSKSVRQSTEAKSGAGSANADDTNEKKFDEESASLKYRLDMGEIGEEEYYFGLSQLRDRYLKEDSSKWRSVNVSLNKWEKSQKQDPLAENEKLFDKEYSDIKYLRDMDEISDDEYYEKLGGLRDKYLVRDTDKWRSVNLELHKKDSSDTKSSNSSGSATVISIDSYIPTLWDDSEEKDKKLKEAVGIQLAGRNDIYSNSIRSAENFTDSANLGSVSSTAVNASPKAGTTLADVVSAINALEKSDEERKISLYVDLYARDLMIGKAAIKDINDITKINGRSPLIT